MGNAVTPDIDALLWEIVRCRTSYEIFTRYAYTASPDDEIGLVGMGQALELVTTRFDMALDALEVEISRLKSNQKHPTLTAVE